MSQASQHRSRIWQLVLRFGFMPLFLIAGFIVNMAPAAAAPRVGPTPAWRTVRDPLYGFTLSYPATWKVTTERNGSHISLLNPATRTTFSPIVTTVTQTPADVLNHAAPVGSFDVHVRTVSGVASLDYVIPAASGKLAAGHGALVGHLQTRHVVAATRNTAGTTNVYTFQITQPVDARGAVSTAVKADDATFEAILGSVRLPASPTPAPGSAAGGTPIGIQPLYGTQGCDTVCWADNNWSYNEYNGYDGAQGPDCKHIYFPNNVETCVQDTYYHWETQTQVSNGTYFQPDFQCAEFAARAIGQDHAIPGLKNGGAYGAQPGTPYVDGNFGASYSYDSFPMTYMGDSYNSDAWFHLGNTGNAYGYTSNPTGLYDYLSSQYLVPGSNNQWLHGTGLIAYYGSDLTQAYPGDLVFFKDGSGNFDHVMVVTSRIQDGWSGGNGWDLYLDGHNAAAYRNLLSDWVSNASQVTVADLQGYYGQTGYPSLSGSWNGFTDGYNQPADWQYTEGSNNTAGATWQPYLITKGSSLPTDPCAVAVYVPSGNATANVTFGVNLADGTRSLRNINEAPIDGWALLYQYGELPSPPQWINVSNNTGNYNQQLGIGQMAFMC